MPEIKYEVIDKIGVVSEGTNGWNKELEQKHCAFLKDILQAFLFPRRKIRHHS